MIRRVRAFRDNSCWTWTKDNLPKNPEEGWLEWAVEDEALFLWVGRLHVICPWPWQRQAAA